MEVAQAEVQNDPQCTGCENQRKKQWGWRVERVKAEPTISLKRNWLPEGQNCKDKGNIGQRTQTQRMF